MALIRWEPARAQTIEQKVNRLFGSVFDGQVAVAANGGTVPRWIPPMDLVEQGDEFVLRADLPGVGKDDVKIELEDNVLTVSGERRAEHEERKEGYYRVERASGSFSRSLRLPEGVDPQGVKANFENGVLEVRVPKPEQRKPQRVAINVAKQETVIEGGADGAGS
jgi:HSP20 family protein